MISSAVLFVEKFEVAPLSDRLSNVYSYKQLNRDVSMDEWLTSFVGVKASGDDVIDAHVIEWVTSYVQMHARAKFLKGETLVTYLQFQGVRCFLLFKIQTRNFWCRS